MKYFNDISSLSELKKIYHQLAKRYHPDANVKGSNEAMAQINSEYEQVFEQLKKFNNESANANVNGFKYTNEAPDLLINIINQLIKFDDLELEICGMWLWLGGDTRAHKDILKDLGFRYSANKQKWYYATTETGTWRKGRKAWTMGQIRSRYGSEIYQDQKQESIEG